MQRIAHTWGGWRQWSYLPIAYVLSELPEGLEAGIIIDDDFALLHGQQGQCCSKFEGSL